LVTLTALAVPAACAAQVQTLPVTEMHPITSQDEATEALGSLADALDIDFDDTALIVIGHNPAATELKVVTLDDTGRAVVKPSLDSSVIVQRDDDGVVSVTYSRGFGPCVTGDEREPEWYDACQEQAMKDSERMLA